jgi:hypothetical protein
VKDSRVLMGQVVLRWGCWWASPSFVWRLQLDLTLANRRSAKWLLGLKCPFCGLSERDTATF